MDIRKAENYVTPLFFEKPGDNNHKVSKLIVVTLEDSLNLGYMQNYIRITHADGKTD